MIGFLWRELKIVNKPTLLITELRQAATWLGGSRLLSRAAEELEQLHEYAMVLMIERDAARAQLLTQEEAP